MEDREVINLDEDTSGDEASTGTSQPKTATTTTNVRTTKKGSRANSVSDLNNTSPVQPKNTSKLLYNKLRILRTGLHCKYPFHQDTFLYLLATISPLTTIKHPQSRKILGKIQILRTEDKKVAELLLKCFIKHLDAAKIQLSKSPDVKGFVAIEKIRAQKADSLINKILTEMGKTSKGYIPSPQQEEFLKECHDSGIEFITKAEAEKVYKTVKGELEQNTNFLSFDQWWDHRKLHCTLAMLVIFLKMYKKKKLSNAEAEKVGNDKLSHLSQPPSVNKKKVATTAGTSKEKESELGTENISTTKTEQTVTTVTTGSNTTTTTTTKQTVTTVVTKVSTTPSPIKRCRQTRDQTVVEKDVSTQKKRKISA